MALMVFVAALAITSLNFGRAANQRAERSISQSETLGNARSRITEWIERAYPFDVTRSTRLLFYPMHGDDRTLVFSSSLGPEAFENVLSRVQLSFDAQQQLIMRYERDRNDRDLPDPNARQHTLIERVKAGRFSYLEPGTPPRWVSTWKDKRDLPLAVRLRVEFIEEDERVFHDLIARPRIQQAAWCDFDPVSRECRIRGREL